MPSDRPSPGRPTPSSGSDDPERDLAGALHEVSNALTVVIGWLERAREGAKLDPEVRRAIEIAQGRARDGRAIARRAIGAESEGDDGEQTVESFVSEALTGVLPEASEKGVELRASRIEGAADALLHEARTALQIVTNLLFNAVSFSPRGGTVTLEAETQDDEIRLSVRDEGPGIVPERAEQIFQRGRTTRAGGAGIGLVHARALARSHGGDLTVEPSDRGACFRLRWPRAAVRSMRSRSLAPNASLGGKRILVVEDDAAVLILLETALSARGAEVVCARNDAEVGNALASGEFHAALVDLSPIASDIAGHFHALRRGSPTARLVVISGSAIAPPEEVVRVAAAWVRKPFDLSEVLASIETDAVLTRAM